MSRHVRRCAHTLRVTCLMGDAIVAPPSVTGQVGVGMCVRAAGVPDVNSGYRERVEAAFRALTRLRARYAAALILLPHGSMAHHSRRDPRERSM